MGRPKLTKEQKEAARLEREAARDAQAAELRNFKENLVREGLMPPYESPMKKFGQRNHLQNKQDAGDHNSETVAKGPGNQRIMRFKNKPGVSLRWDDTTSPTWVAETPKGIQYLPRTTRKLAERVQRDMDRDAERDAEMVAADSQKTRSASSAPSESDDRTPPTSRQLEAQTYFLNDMDITSMDLEGQDETLLDYLEPSTQVALAPDADFVGPPISRPTSHTGLNPRSRSTSVEEIKDIYEAQPGGTDSVQSSTSQEQTRDSCPVLTSNVSLNCWDIRARIRSIEGRLLVKRA